MKTKFATLAAALVLAGCINLAPDHQRGPLPVAEQWPAETAQAGQALQWQQFYAGDARLVALIDIALKNNRDLRAAVFNAEQARAQARIADANRWPTLNAAGVYTRVPSDVTSGTPRYQAGVQVSAYELDLLGKIRNQSDAATARYLASREGQRAAQITLIAAVASSHLALQADSAMLELVSNTLAAREESEKLQRRKFDVGVASALDMSTAESATGAARAAYAQAKRQRAQDENALVLLLGQPLPADLPAATATGTLPDVPVGLPSAVLLARPDVVQAEQTLIAAEANIGAARAAFFPSISLTGQFGSASNALSDLFSNTVWSFVGQLAMPIFDAGRNRANLDSAKAAQGAAQAQYEKAVQTAFREVADALAGRATYGEQVAAQEQQTRAARDTLRLIKLRFDNGAASQLDLLTAQTNAFAAEQALLQVQLAAQANGVQLYKALGGGV